MYIKKDVERGENENNKQIIVELKKMGNK